jgi:NAD(P)-dependent dehydrogenase (short-subunit alcohol dehydrogenase family)
MVRPEFFFGHDFSNPLSLQVLNISSSLGAMYGMGGEFELNSEIVVLNARQKQKALNFAYRASKASLNALTLVMAAEYPHVRINSACVGIVDTDMTKHLSNVAKVSPEEAVEQLLWLLEDDAPTAGFWRNGEQIYW